MTGHESTSYRLILLSIIQQTGTNGRTHGRIRRAAVHQTYERSMDMEDSIASDKVQIERKQFFFDLRENRRGILLRITEEVRGHRDTIIIPATGLKDFSDALNKMIDVIDHEGLDPSDPSEDQEDYDDDPEGDDGDDVDDGYDDDY
jgi:hypothetical protein